MQQIEGKHKKRESKKGRENEDDRRGMIDESDEV